MKILRNCTQREENDTKLEAEKKFLNRGLTTFSGNTQLENIKEEFIANIMLCGKTHSQVQLLPGAFNQGEVLLDEKTDVLLQQLSLAL